MKFGSETGSLVNHLMGSSSQIDPVVDMPATLLSWSDRAAATVTDVFVKNGRTIVEVTYDLSTVVRGSSVDGSAEYRYERDPSGSVRYFRREKTGEWICVRKNEDTGRWVKSGRGGILLGRRETYRDPSF